MAKSKLSEQYRQETTLLWPEPLQWLYAFCRRYIFFCFVLLFLSFFWYVRTYYHKLELSLLEQQKEQIIGQIEEVREERHMLTLQLNSESDLSWQELTLMRVLGVKPEGYTKVVFR